MKIDKINSQYVFAENNKVLLRIDAEANTWYPINFQWIPVIKLNKSMNK